MNEKIEKHAANKNGNTDSFMASLTTGERMAMWKRFEYARTPQQQETWAKCSGPGSQNRKQRLLAIFAKHRCDPNAGALVESFITITTTHKSQDTQEWVPLAQILQRFGVQEAWRRIQKGSIQSRKDENVDEWEFSLKRHIEGNSTENAQGGRMEQKGKMKGEEFLKAVTAAQGDTPGIILPPDLAKQLGFRGKEAKEAQQLALLNADDDDDEEVEDPKAGQADRLSKITCTATNVLQKIKDMMKLLSESESDMEVFLAEQKVSRTEKMNREEYIATAKFLRGKLAKLISSKGNKAEKAKDLLVRSAQTIKTMAAMTQKK